jgi:SAM-dependent methyltransferase
VLLLISAAVLADEVVLVRAFSIGQWHHFAYMVISIALLGFGASGTLLALLARRTKSFHAQTGGAGWLAACAVLFAVTFPLAFALVQNIPFDPFLIVWERRQLLYLGCYYLVLFVPFFAAATVIGLALITKSEDSPRLYFYNLMGSAAGSALAVGLLEIAPVEQTVLTVAGLAQGAALFALLDALTLSRARHARQLATLGLLAMLGMTLYFAARPPAVRLSQYKGLSYALNLPGARWLTTSPGAIGRIDVVESPAIRQAPGLSLVTPQEASIPPQLGLFVDAETAGAITAFDGNTSALGYLDWMSTAAPYFARPDPRRVCVLGAGGGANVLLALRHGARHVDAVELDRNVVRLLREDFHRFSGGLYGRADVHVHVAEARAFVESAREQWDIIDISLVDSFASAAVGLGAVNETYLYTQEALAAYLQHLRPGGVLAVTRWIRTPPRDEIKLFATAVAALEGMGLRPADRIVLIRSWATATLLIKRDAFVAVELTAVQRWAEDRLFDIAYFPGMTTGEGNRFNVLEHDVYAEAGNALLAGGGRREEFFRDYPFFVTPATDNRPYFFHFFRWRALPLMLSTAGFAWVPFVEWGYLILVATLLQSAVLGGLLIGLPLTLLRHKGASRPPYPRGARLTVLAYFLALGIGFMFVEMALIQRLVFFLANPVYAVAVVLAGLLLVAGLGSWWAARLVAHGYSVKRLAGLAALGVAVISVIYAFGLYPALRTALALPLATRVVVAFAVMLPLAIMGMLFPLGLRQLGRIRAELLPWAWAINGCASVVATSLATLLAMGAGLTAVLLAASGCYAVAAVAVRQWARHDNDELHKGRCFEG